MVTNWNRRDVLPDRSETRPRQKGQALAEWVDPRHRGSFIDLPLAVVP